jgi:hypothetical protein
MPRPDDRAEHLVRLGAVAAQYHPQSKLRQRAAGSSGVFACRQDRPQCDGWRWPSGGSNGDREGARARTVRAHPRRSHVGAGALADQMAARTRGRWLGRNAGDLYLAPAGGGAAVADSVTMFRNGKTVTKPTVGRSATTGSSPRCSGGGWSGSIPSGSRHDRDSRPADPRLSAGARLLQSISTCIKVVLGSPACRARTA